MARHDERLPGGRRRARRHARTEADLAPLPAYGTLPPPAPWRADGDADAPAMPAEQPGARDHDPRHGDDDPPAPGGGPAPRRERARPRPRRSTARPIGATAVPTLVPGGFVRPLPQADPGTLQRLAPPPTLDPLPRLSSPQPMAADDLLDPFDEARRRGAAVVAGVVAGAVTLPPAFGLSVSHAAIDPVPNPTPAVQLPAGIEAFSPWLPQVTCDPVAKPGVLAFSQLVLEHWGQGSSWGITRACHLGGASEHKEGRAWDFKLGGHDYADQVAGQRVIDWLLADDALNARRFGIMYIIWNERIWSTYKRKQGWRAYAGAHDHTDHIHFSFSWAGAMKRTSWWTGEVAPTEYGPCRKYIGEAIPLYGDTINVKPCPEPIPKPKPKPKPETDEKPAEKKKPTKTTFVYKRKTIVVRSGDTLSDIAARYKTTVRKLVRINKLTDANHIVVGQKLRVPVRVKVTVSAPKRGPKSGPSKPTKGTPSRARVIVVKAGDTLGAIAIRYGSTVDAIVKANKLANPDRIYPGQKLRIPA